MTAKTHLWCVCLGLLAAGCSDYQFAKGDADSGAQAPEDEGGITDYLRVDVYPSDQNPELLPETHILDEEWEGLALEMNTPVTLAGQVWGYDATPYFDISVPGSTIPIEALVSVYRAGTIVAASDHTEPTADGAFTVRIPHGDDYTFTVVPVAPAQLPFLVRHDLSILQSEIGELIELDYGAPVYGRIDNRSGYDLSSLDIVLQLRDPLTDTTGPAVAPDEDGYFQLRAFPGASYQVVMAGRSGDLVPVTARDVVVESEDGAEVDFELGPIQGITVAGQVITTASAAVANATVRFSSLELYDFPGGELTLDDITSSRGEYRVALLPGRYVAEFIAPANQQLSPHQEIIVVSEQGDGDDFDVQLAGLLTIESQVLGPRGEPLAGVTVVGTERGFDGYTYTTTSDEGGYFQLNVPGVKLQFVLTPPEGEASVTYMDVPVEEFPAIIMLEEGDAISGQVLHDDQPVAFALVEVRDSADQLYATTMTDEAGSFQVRVRWEGEPVDLPLDTGK